MHWLDALSLRWLRRQHIFEGGWGDVAAFAPVATSWRSPSPAAPVALTWSAPRRERNLPVQDGAAPSPVPGLPPSLSTLHVRRLLPIGRVRARVVVPPSWGDGGYGLRMWLVGALVARGIEPWLLEGAWFGQRAAPMHTVEDFFRMGLAHVEETRALVQTAAADGTPVAVAGYSMAGQLGGLAVASLPLEVPVVVMAASDSPAVVFCDGPLSQQVRWEALGDDGRERLRAVMEESSLLKVPPPRSERREVVVTTRDGIVAPAATERVATHWGVEPTRLATGHVGAYALHRRHLQRLIANTATSS